MPAYAAQLVAEEVECHLRERCAAAIELGATPETAQFEAIQGFGSADTLSREFGRQASVWAVAPVQGNSVMFGLLLIPIIYEYGFLHFDYVNLATVAAWMVWPALCRRWPWLGVFAGIAALQVFLVWLPGRGQPFDVFGMLAFLGLSVASYLVGWLLRRMILRIRDRQDTPMARS